MNWEFLERQWIGEAIGFSEWLRDERDPEVLRSLSLDFELPSPLWQAVLARIKLPLNPGMTLAELRQALGAPLRTSFLQADRETYSFRREGNDEYEVSCTVHKSGGLTYLLVVAPLLAVEYDA
jgi:hypothetical protein